MMLPREHFVALTRRSAPFLDFCKRRLGALLDLSRHQLQQTYASEASAERTMATPLAQLMRGPALTCSPETRCVKRSAACMRPTSVPCLSWSQATVARRSAAS